MQTPVTKKAVIYEFFERSAQPRTLLYRPQEGWPQGLAEFAAEFGEQLRKPLTKDLSDLDGSYRIFQPAWTISAMRSQRVLISRLKISTSGGFTRFTEAQQFTDPDAPSISVDEVTDGAVLYLSGNIVLFGISRQTQSCMFYTAWSTFPVPGNGTPVNRLRGSMMGIVGAGPHNSSPFVAYRSKEPFDQIETGIVRPGHKLLAPDILEWLGIEV
ncbi:hypothetical protein K3720_11955 [Leisingera caerulea]|uniref:hypothetical protein n=1 Tax=Leisingera caerulea TaxID=506591 RepID=UPI0021A848DE|nr:hypothetical protein [Leisingera caerulea]UWQ48645.1 hypothetical protein K3720_11955 [Leisingera caerulea]